MNFNQNQKQMSDIVMKKDMEKLLENLKIKIGTIAYKDNTGDEVKIINSNNNINNSDINSTLSKIQELEKEEEIIENFEV